MMISHRFPSAKMTHVDFLVRFVRRYEFGLDLTGTPSEHTMGRLQHKVFQCVQALRAQKTRGLPMKESLWNVLRDIEHGKGKKGKGEGKKGAKGKGSGSGKPNKFAEIQQEPGRIPCSPASSIPFQGDLLRLLGGPHLRWLGRQQALRRLPLLLRIIQIRLIRSC